MTSPAAEVPARGPWWKWWVCGLLLLATTLNYMDRLTLNYLSDRILREFGLDEVQYGQLESAFAYAFALGAIVAGWMADRWSVRWLYPAAVLAWSAAGFATGLAQGFVGLMLCRFALGFFEAGNWPNSLRTTQHILPPNKRSLGNGILQSGAAIGAIVTPSVIGWLVTRHDSYRVPLRIATSVSETFGQVEAGNPPVAMLGPWLAPIYQPGLWRWPFMIIGAAGASWAVLWLLSVRQRDLPKPQQQASSSSPIPLLAVLVSLLGIDVAWRLAQTNSLLLPAALAPIVTLPAANLLIKASVSAMAIASVFVWLFRCTRGEDALARPEFVRRFFVLAILVISINTTWHYFRAWLPLFLQRQHGYLEADRNLFLQLFNVATDIGSLTAGFASLWLTRYWSVHWSRVVIFVFLACLTCLSLAVAVLPAGPLLLGTLLVIGFASLGLFPVYYSFSQELTVKHQGKVTGALGCINWMAMYLLHEVVGESVKQTKSYSEGLSLAGLAPLVGVAALLLFWGGGAKTAPSGAVAN